MRKLSVPSVVLSVLLGGVASWVIHDWSVPTARQFSTRSAVFAIEEYRRVVSPRIGNVVRCRFQPTCSAYGLETVRKYGGVRGGWRALKRVARCHPGTPMGTIDPP